MESMLMRCFATASYQLPQVCTSNQSKDFPKPKSHKFVIEKQKNAPQ